MSDGNEIRQHIDDLEAELRSETALAPLEETLSSIVSALPDIVYRLDAEGKIVFISDAIRDYGYDPSALAGRSMLDLVHPADRNRAEYRINERRTGGRSTRSLELRLTTADSEAVSFELNETTTDGEADGAGGAGGDPGATLLVDAEGVYASQDPQADTFQYTQGVARDITQRKLLDEALDQARQAMLERMATHSEQIGAAYDQLKEGLGEAAASEERYRSLVENLPVGVTHTTLYGDVLYQNPYARAMLGYTVEELSQVKAEDLYANPQDRAELLRTLAEREVHSFEYEMRRKGGRTIWVRGTTRVIKDEHGMPIEYHSFIEDVTDRRLMEQEYVRLEEQLRQAQKMEAVGQITAGIAHNFNNLLQGITGNLQLALLDAPEELKRLLEDADEVTGRAAEMVHQLMIFSRQGLQPSNRTISIWPVVSTTIEMCRRTFDKRIELVAVEPEFEAKVSGGRRPASAGAPQPVHQRARRPERGRDEGCVDSNRCGGGGCRCRAGVQSHGRTVGAAPAVECHRQRRRHGPGHHQAHLRSVLHDEGRRRGHRVGTGDRVRYRHRTQGLGGMPQRTGRGDDVLHTPACDFRW